MQKFLIKVLKKTPLLSRLSSEDLMQIALLADKKEYESKQMIFREGDRGDGFYIITGGSVCVLKKQKKGVDQVNTLSKGDYFGEGALIYNKPRGASIQALETGTICAFWSKAKFQQLKLVGLRFPQRNAISTEVVAKLVNIDEKLRVKTAQQRLEIYRTIQENDLFRNLSTEHMGKVIDKMHKKKIKAGTTIITQGESGNVVFVIEKGSFDVFVEDKKRERKKKVAVRRAGQLVGELALLFNAPRNATVVATQNSECWLLDRFTFRYILKDVSEKETKRNVDFLRKVELLAPLSESERCKIAEALEEVVFEAGSSIVRQGEKGYCMYIVKKGDAAAYVSGQTAPVKHYKPGDYFGEKALIDNEAKGLRAATILCKTRCVCVQLDRNAVFGLLGPIHQDLKKRVSEYSSGTNGRASSVEGRRTDSVSSSRAAAARADFKQIKWSFRELKRGKVLGRGSFGIVQIVSTPDGQTYALKGVAKKQVVKDRQQPHIVSEKKVMEMLDHPFLVRLFGTYRDASCVYFLLELCQGGELFTVLRARTRFDLKLATFYAASVVLMFEYLHSFNIVYRDLKPENLLLDSRGYLKLTDFGFAKQTTERTYTLCGTPDYLAPEILEGRGHGKGVDWWTLGILLYEMLASFPPFFDDVPKRTYAKIMYKEIGNSGFPSDTFTPEARALIKDLLRKKPHLRLGVVKGGARRVKEQPFFKGFSFKDLLDQKMLPPPPRPKVKGNDDVSNFSDEGEAPGIPAFRPKPGYDAAWEDQFDATA